MGNEKSPDPVRVWAWGCLQMGLDRLRALTPIFFNRAGSRSELQLTDTVKEEDLGAALQLYEISICLPTSDRVRNPLLELLIVGAIDKVSELHEKISAFHPCT
jgi:hypothetical protein